LLVILQNTSATHGPMNVKFSPTYQPSEPDAHKNRHTNMKMRSPDIKITLHNTATLTSQCEVSQRIFC